MGEGGRKAWRETDLTRAISAAKEAGLCSYRIEIANDGTISIVVCASSGADASVPSSDAVLPARG